jgi:hypothetical protein
LKEVAALEVEEVAKVGAVLLGAAAVVLSKMVVEKAVPEQSCPITLLVNAPRRLDFPRVVVVPCKQLSRRTCV